MKKNPRYNVKIVVFAILTALFGYSLIANTYENGLGVKMSLSSMHNMCQGIVGALNSNCSSISGEYYTFLFLFLIFLGFLIFFIYKKIRSD